jgi:hypothetical protein
MNRSLLLKAFLASFALYLFPLVGPHTFWFLGQYLVMEIVRSPHGRDPLWIALDFGVAIGLQLVVFALLLWVFARPRFFRLLILLASIPVCSITLQLLYLVVIPSRFLIEPDVVPEKAEWKQECSIPNMSLAAVRSPADLPLARSGQAWVRGADGNSYALIEMPGCRLVPLAFQQVGQPFTQPFVLPNGRCLFSTWDAKAARMDWWDYGGPGTSAGLLQRPPSDPNRASPILSDDGEWVAWIQFVPGVVTPPLPEEVIVRSLRNSEERSVSLQPLGRGSFVLLALDMNSEELTLFEHDYATSGNKVFAIGLDGAERWGPLKAEGVEAQSTTFLQAGQGWVTWDAYRENGRYQIAWSLPRGPGKHEVRKGRGITAVAVDPTGTYVAVSVTTSLNIGHIRDSVYVLRASDGAAVFCHYLPTYTRSEVAFLGNSHFAYTDWDGAHSQVRVLQLPK